MVWSGPDRHDGLVWSGAEWGVAGVWNGRSRVVTMARCGLASSGMVRLLGWEWADPGRGELARTVSGAWEGMARLDITVREGRVWRVMSDWSGLAGPGAERRTGAGRVGEVRPVTSGWG